MNKAYDVVVIGAGVVGLTFAAALPESLNIAVLERKIPNLEFLESDIETRVFAINHASQQVFKNLKVWRAIQALRVSPYRNMHVWDSQGSGEVQFDSASVGQPELGHIVESKVLVKVLWEKLATCAHVDLLVPAQLQAYSVSDDAVNVVLTDNKKLEAKLIVGADGANSLLRQQMGVEMSTWSYQQRAIVATVKTEKSHQKTAWQRFLSTGPLAFLPLQDAHHCSIVWSADDDVAQALMKLDDKKFSQRLSEDVGFKLGVVTLVNQRAVFDLSMRHVKNYVQQRAALIGDAAHTIHPLAGQGVNLGIVDAIHLADSIVKAVEKERDIGSFSTLRRYERWRKGHNTLMIAAMEGFKRLFAIKNGAVVQLRSAGLNFVNKVDFIKRCFIKQAMGDS